LLASKPETTSLKLIVKATGPLAMPGVLSLTVTVGAVMSAGGCPPPPPPIAASPRPARSKELEPPNTDAVDAAELAGSDTGTGIASLIGIGETAVTGATATAGADKAATGKDAEAGLSDDASVELLDEEALLIESGAITTLAGWADCAGSAIDAMDLSAAVLSRAVSAVTASCD
jgi:hypothetical protein